MTVKRAHSQKIIGKMRINVDPFLSANMLLVFLEHWSIPILLRQRFY